MTINEPSAEELQQRITLLEQGMAQSAKIRELWAKSAKDLKATKAELSESLAQLTATHEELEQKNTELEALNLQLQDEMDQRERVEVELRLAQKLEAIGQLAAGIAHEINTPIQFMADNNEYLADAFGSYSRLTSELQALIDTTSDATSPLTTVRELIEREQLDVLEEDVPDAISDTRDGIQQVAEIVRSMKKFSQRRSAEKAPVDLNEALETTATVARSEWKDVATIEWDLDAELPKVYADAAELNQVFLNLLINSVEAVSRAGGDGLGHIWISTSSTEDGASIRFSDTGGGVEESIQEQIFDPFFTTKDVGEGSGQGLSIAHSIIVDHHGGTITLDPNPGIGATFTIWLPAKPTT